MAYEREQQRDHRRGETDYEPSDDEIRREAYFLWEKAGSKMGDDREKYWNEARKRLTR